MTKPTLPIALRPLVFPALAGVVACLCGGAVPALGLAAGSPVGRPIQDPAVVPAGGGQCQACRSGQCRHGGHGHQAGCRDGRCVPYCPVRPQEFGFYGTQWRRWPGQGVVPVSDDRAVTPVVPPRLAIPGPDQESMRSPEDDADLPEPETGRADEASPADPLPPLPPTTPQPPLEPAPRTLEPAPQPEPSRPEPAAEPEMKTPDPETPEPKAPEPEKPDLPKPAVPPLPEEENLFDARPRSTIRRRFLVGQAGGEGNGAAEVRPAAHGSLADPRDVPPVPFDPAAEGRRLRTTR